MSTAPLMISVSGVRGLIGETLTPQVGVEFGQAFGHFLRENTKHKTQNTKPVVAIGRDTRPSGPMVFGAVAAGLMSVGVDVVDVDVATTPSVALMGRFLKTDASIVITASHNPIIWNGIKFLRHDGIAYPPEQAAEIKKIYFAKPWKLVGIEGLGRLTTDSRAHAHHVQTVLQYFDVKGIAHQRYRVVLDSVNGAGCVGTPMLLSKLGAELIHMNAEGTGIFAHTPEPTKENLTDLCAKVKEKRAAVGFAQDPDADRLAIVDENGTYIGEEYTLALCTYARMLVKPVPVVANLSSSRMVDDIAAKYGQKVFRTPVGEANVAGKMQEVAGGNGGGAGGVIGGEGNGGIIDLRVGPVRDSFLGMAMVLDMLTRTGKTVSQLVGEIPRYAMIKTKFECTPEQSAALVAAVKEKFADQRLDTSDGVRIDWADGWVHVRQSNTEPIARVIAEAGDVKTANELIGKVQSLR
ncbi:MAG TPA: phosphoglucosamine mutase [Phycisphaerae bacterium]|nr:phosphoglucosamine mutase [Phycisphaerae bacterium]